MKLNNICNEVAARILGEPKTLVEHMIEGIGKGIYKVVDNPDDYSKEYINIRDYGLHAATKFRKANE